MGNPLFIEFHVSHRRSFEFTTKFFISHFLRFYKPGPSESLSTPQRLQVEGLETPVTPDSTIQTYNVSLPAPSLSVLRGDDERLLETLEGQHSVICKSIDEEVLRTLSPSLRSLNWEASTSVRDAEVIAVGPVDGHSLGMAVDLGTTKIAGYLVDLETGQTLSAKGMRLVLPPCFVWLRRAGSHSASYQ